jgi:hypothetical protein
VVPDLGYDDVDAHHAHAVARGAQIISPREADVTPEDWGGTSVDLG